MSRCIWCWVVVAVLVSIVVGRAADSDKEKAATVAAEKWLALVDGGKYAESWTETAGYFRNAVKQDAWEQTMQAIRAPLGKVVLRKLGSRTYATSLPGAPDGQYVVVIYTTSFENKQEAVETVTPMLDTNGEWRVSGYFIK